MDDHIDLARPRRFERSFEILKEVVASSTANDPRAAGQVEPKVCVGHEQDAHVTPTEDRRQARVRERRCDA